MEDDAQNTPETAPDPTGQGPSRRAGLVCERCGGPITARATGRIPKWCTRTCRQRAWEQAQAVASGRPAVRVVHRKVEVQVPVKVIERVEVPMRLRGGPAWETALRELARQLDVGLIADRDIPALMTSLDQVVNALRKRRAYHRYYKTHWPSDPQ